MKTTLKQCSRCKTMKNIRENSLICKRCEEDLKQKIKRKKLELEAGEILSEQGEHN